MPTFVPLTTYREYPAGEMIARSAAFFDEMMRRRTVRDFDSRPMPREVIENAIRTAGTGPSGANFQPWRFVAISNPAVKHEIREAAEIEEREFYERKAPPEWLRALEQLGTDANKPFLETAPWLIAIFTEAYGVLADGTRVKNYYVQESVGIATGLLIAALHHAGVATLTHTPSPMAFLNRILGRPANERPFLLLVAGYPAPGARVPDIQRKRLEEVAVWV